VENALWVAQTALVASAQQDMASLAALTRNAATECAWLKALAAQENALTE